jgi:hypothetical protein
MGVLVVTQARSSGATTTALALGRAWARPVLVVEADPAGGDLAARYGVATSPGLVDLAAAPGSHPAALVAMAQDLGGVRAVVAPVGAEATQAALEALGPGLGWLWTAGDEVDVIVDCGRLPLPPSPLAALVEAATLLMFVTRPTAPGVVSLRHRLSSLPPGLRERSVAVVVGDRPYGADEVAAVLGIPVVGVLADDPVAAAAFGSLEPARMGRSALLRSACVVAEELAEALGDGEGSARVLSESAPTRRRLPCLPARFSLSQNGAR